MKYKRQSKILEIIRNNEIETQEALLMELKKNKFEVTQATVSRDIKELKLIKTLSKKGKYKYDTYDSQTKLLSDRLVRLFKDSMISIDGSGNILVIKTVSGAAQAAGATIDAMNYSEVVGTIAGDDTIFILVRDPEKLNQVKEKFLSYIN